MKTFFYKIISKITYLLPLIFLIKLSGIKVIFPFYHTVSNNPPAHVKHLYKVRTVTQFRKDLDFLTKYYTSTQTVSEEHNKITQNNFYLSFDDGLSESYDVIIPILKELSMLKQSVEKVSNMQLGYPINLDYDYTQLLNFYSFSLNNPGTPFTDSLYRLGTRGFEREVLYFFAQL